MLSRKFELQRISKINEDPMNSKIRNMKKCDLHVHINGSVPTDTIKNLILEYNVELPMEFDLNGDLQVLYNADTLREYFKPWEAFKRLPIGYSCLEKMIKDSLQRMKCENVNLVEFRNSPFNISRLNNISLTEAVNWLTEASMKYSDKYNIEVGLILSLTRHENTYEDGLQLLEAIKNNKGKNIVGVDLSGDEDCSFDYRIAKIYQKAKHDFGLGVSIHAGETGSLNNILWAMNECEADRIGHGLAAAKSVDVMNDLIEKDVCLELCLTSNLRTGSVRSLANHPITEFFKYGVPFVICSDNPFVHNAMISDEYITAYKLLSDRELLNRMGSIQRKYSFVEKEKMK